ncbi:MAG: hypothetical protein V4755_13765, partial [Curtobacterium sp.]
MPRGDAPHRRSPRLTLLVTAAVTAVALVLTGTSVLGGRAAAGAATTDPVSTADCRAGRVLDVVAHPDDDLLFQGSDLRASIESGACVRTVVVTAADSGYPAWYWRERQTGLGGGGARG